MKRLVISIFSLAFLFSACTAPGSTPSATTTLSLLPTATSFAADSPAITPVPTATYSQKKIGAFITVSEPINVRGGPSTWFDSIGQLSTGQQYAVVGQTYDWWQIQFGEQVGWVYKLLSSFTGDAQAIPEATPPTLPSP